MGLISYLKLDRRYKNLNYKDETDNVAEPLEITPDDMPDELEEAPKDED